MVLSLHEAFFKRQMLLYVFPSLPQTAGRCIVLIHINEQSTPFFFILVPPTGKSIKTKMLVIYRRRRFWVLNNYLRTLNEYQNIVLYGVRLVHYCHFYRPRFWVCTCSDKSFHHFRKLARIESHRRSGNHRRQLLLLLKHCEVKFLFLFFIFGKLQQD